MLKIITVCGLGVGSSLIMKMTVDNAMKQLGKSNYDIEHWDMGTVKSKPCDFIVTTYEFEKILQNKTMLYLFEILLM